VWEFYTYGRNGVQSCNKGGRQKFRETSSDETRCEALAEGWDGVGTVGKLQRFVRR
jgi:hypothetical protein